METKTGRITAKGISGQTKEESKSGRAWTLYKFTIEDKKYSTFDAKIGEQFKIGDTVIMEGETDGQYWNMTTMDYCLLDKAPVEKAGLPSDNQTFRKADSQGNTPAQTDIKKETGEFQSTVWNHAIAPNSYEVGKAGCRFKLYFETVKELQEKIAELKLAGLLDEAETIKVA